MQQTKTKRDKRASQNRLRRLLVPWRQEIVSGYRLGDTISDPEAVPMLNTALNVNYKATAKDVLNIDIREYKQESETEDSLIYKAISIPLINIYVTKSNLTTRSSTATANKLVNRTTQLALENQWDITEARRALNNYIKSQSGTITLTESQWAVETTRRVAVVRVKDPLINSIERISGLIDVGDFNGARRLARQVAKVARLPLSINQGKIVRDVMALRSSSIGPLQQAERLSSIRKRAEEMERSTKTWRILEPSKVRDSHQDVNGQEQPVDAPFQLPGGLLQYPGDGALGAATEEIINCRCTAVYN